MKASLIHPVTLQDNQSTNEFSLLMHLLELIICQSHSHTRLLCDSVNILWLAVLFSSVTFRNEQPQQNDTHTYIMPPFLLDILWSKVESLSLYTMIWIYILYVTIWQCFVFLIFFNTTCSVVRLFAFNDCGTYNDKIAMLPCN